MKRTDYNPETIRQKVQYRLICRIILLLLLEIAGVLFMRLFGEQYITSRLSAANVPVALRMLLMENYRTSDREMLAAAVQKKRIWEQDMCRAIFGEKLIRGDGDLPMECVPQLFLDHPETRYHLVKALLTRGLLPDELREECRCDANMLTRKLVEE